MSEEQRHGSDPTGELSLHQQPNQRPRVTYVTTHLPYPFEQGGGAYASHAVIQAVAASASVSLVVLCPTNHGESTVRAAEEHYLKTCSSFSFHTFPHLNPGSSLPTKTWHYLTGYPRQGFWSSEAETILLEQMGRTGCDILWCNTTHEAKYLPAAKRLNCRSVLTTQNVESDLVRQEMGAKTGYSRLKMAVRCWDLRRLERFATKYADIVTAITTIDLEHYAGMKGRDGVSLLSIGYSLKDTGIADTSREEPNAICFIGSMDWPPNVKAAQYLVDEVMPRIWRSRPDTKCYLVGRDPGPELTRLASSNVVITGRVSSIDEYYERVPVVALPIQGVGGVKIKLIHALAAGKAIVSTSAGAAGLDVRNGQEMLIADRPDEFAAAVIKLLESKPERHRLGQNAKTFVKEYLSPNETCRQAKEILQRLLKG